MVFELTDALLDSIIKALENQENSFLVDAQKCALISSQSVKADEDKYYKIPEWNSADGFALMEDFVNNLHSPLAYTDLQAVLHSGKGVFRGFKDVLKSYPIIQRRWHYFKNKQLSLYVNQWYNSLRETWGLEQLDYEGEDVEDLVYNDFSFQEYNPATDRDCVIGYMEEIAKEYGFEWTEDVQNAIKDIWLNQFEYGNSNGEFGFICKTALQDFAGNIIFAPCNHTSNKTVILTSFFVLKTYRGLGIGKELLSMSLATLKQRGFEWVIIANTFIPDTMQPLLTSYGFEKFGSGFILNLFAN